MSARVLPELPLAVADGTVLIGDLFLPEADASACVVARTPYGTPGLWPEAVALAEAGLAVLVQDVRGRHRSGGTFRPGADEAPDGTATLDWVTAQEWSDGRVLLAGTAYEAYTAWCAAPHPAVVGVASRQPWPSEDAPALDDELWWRTDLGTGDTVRPGLYDAVTALAPGLADALASPGFGDRWPVPLGPWPPTRDTWAEPRERAARAVQAASVPTLHLGSWYCASAATTLRHARLAHAATVVVGGWASPLTHHLLPDCALTLPEGPDPTDLMHTWLLAQAHATPFPPPPLCLVLPEAWTARSPLQPPAPRRAPEDVAQTMPLDATATPLPSSASGRRAAAVRPSPRDVAAEAVFRLLGGPGARVPSAGHSADLGPAREGPGLVRLEFAGPVGWHGAARLGVEVRAPEEVGLVATFVHARPDGVRTRITDAVARVPAGGGRVELRAAPTAVRLPEGHALHVELTVGRPPRHAAPARPVALDLVPQPLLLPQPEDLP